jgi:hypothetical protein
VEKAMADQDAYEFTSRENEIIGKAATWSLRLAVASFVMVVVHLVFAIVGTDFAGTSFRLLVFDMGAGVVSASCYLAAGVLFAVTAGALRRVVDTQGDDLKHMLKVLDTLHRIFVLRIALVFLTVIAVVAVIATGEGL